MKALLEPYWLVVLCYALQLHALDNTHKGRVLFYLEKLLEANPERPWAEAALTNLEQVVFFRAQRRDGDIEYFETLPYQLSQREC